MSDALSGLSSIANIGSSIFGMFANNNAQAIQAQIAANQEQQVQNQQQYQAMLTAEAMRRSSAGSTDSFGSSLTYDPGSNTWISALGALPRAAQTSNYISGIRRNSEEQPLQMAVNQMAAMRAAQAEPGANAARLNLENIPTMSPEAMFGGLTQASTIANRQAQDPVIQQTLREFARTGTAAGPVLSQMMRTNQDELSKEMADNYTRSQIDAPNINNARMQGAAGKFSALSGAANPSMSYSPLSTGSPEDALTSLMASRANGAAQPATQGAFGSAYSQNATVGAARNAMSATNPNNTLEGIGRSLGQLADNSWIKKLFGPAPDSNNGDGAPTNGTAYNPYAQSGFEGY